METSIQDLNSRHFKILDMCLHGKTNKQICDELSMSPSQVSIIINSPSFQHELAKRRSQIDDLTNSRIASKVDEVHDAIKRGARAAADRLLGGVLSENEAIAIKSSSEILDRAGYPKISRLESRSVTINLTADDVDLIRDTMILDSDA